MSFFDGAEGVGVAYVLHFTVQSYGDNIIPQ